jgi:hypothetical protein
VDSNQSGSSASGRFIRLWWLALRRGIVSSTLTLGTMTHGKMIVTRQSGRFYPVADRTKSEVHRVILGCSVLGSRVPHWPVKGCRVWARSHLTVVILTSLCRRANTQQKSACVADFAGSKQATGRPRTQQTWHHFGELCLCHGEKAAELAWGHKVWVRARSLRKSQWRTSHTFGMGGYVHLIRVA